MPAGVLVIDPPEGLLNLEGAVARTEMKETGVGLRIDIVTIFPDYFGARSGVSLIGKAAARGDIDFRVHDLRRWTTDVHHTVDDTPFGGGPGMVMKPDVWGDALDDIVAAPDGDARPAGGAHAERGAVHPGAGGGLRGRSAHLVFACGRYEGIDSRVVGPTRDRMPVDEVSIGDYVLAGGEAAVAGDRRGGLPAAARRARERAVGRRRLVRRAPGAR